MLTDSGIHPPRVHKTLKVKVEDISEDSMRIGRNVIRLKTAYHTGNIDPETTAGLVKSAMGKRSQRKYAEDTGINVSSISRVLNGQIAEISDNLLARIAAYADPDSGVTLEKLMSAQGIVESDSRAELGAQFVQNCRRVIADGLLKKGFSVAYGQQSLDHKLQRICDFEIRTDALGNGGRWLIETKLVTANIPGRGMSQGWIDGAMAAYYRGEKIGRLSVVVEVRALFEQMKRRLAETSIADEISVLLIPIGSDKVLDEYVAPLKDGRKPEFTFSKEDA